MPSSRCNVLIDLPADTALMLAWRNNACQGPCPLGPLPPKPDNPKAKIRFVRRETWTVTHALSRVQRRNFRNNDGNVTEAILARKTCAPPLQPPARPPSPHLTCRPFGRYNCIKANPTLYGKFWRSLHSVKLVLNSLATANAQDVTLQLSRAEAAANVSQQAAAAAQLAAVQQAAAGAATVAAAQLAQGSAEQSAQNMHQFALHMAQAQANSHLQMVAFLQNNSPQQLLAGGGAPLPLLLGPPAAGA